MTVMPAAGAQQLCQRRQRGFWCVQMLKEEAGEDVVE